MRGSVKFAAFVLIVVMTAVISYANSDAIYNYYLRTWYLSVRKMTVSKAIVQAENMRDEYTVKIQRAQRKDDQLILQEEYERKFRAYVDTMTRVFAGADQMDGGKMYQTEFARYAGLRYLDFGDPMKGALLLLSSFGSSIKPEDANDYMRAIMALYDKKMYGDIAAELSKRSHPSNRDLFFMHGSSLYHLNRYREALVLLHQAESAGRSDDILYMEIASCCRELKLYKEGIIYARKALAEDPRDHDARALLVQLLTLDGQIKDAEKLSRKR
jgi:tetratricopeptide (TPR) repeat protein